MMPEFGTWLKRALAMAGMRQRDLAKLMGTTEVSVSRWVHGTRTPRYKQMRWILDYFGMLNAENEGHRFGSWISMGQISEDWLVASIAETTKRLLEQMHKSVEPVDDISLIFKLDPTKEDGIYSVTGAWKCYGKLKGPVKRE